MLATFNKYSVGSIIGSLDEHIDCLQKVNTQFKNNNETHACTSNLYAHSICFPFLLLPCFMWFRFNKTYYILCECYVELFSLSVTAASISIRNFGIYAVKTNECIRSRILPSIVKSFSVNSDRLPKKSWRDECNMY